MKDSYLVRVAELKEGDVLTGLRRHYVQVDKVEWVSKGRVRISWHHHKYPLITGETMRDDIQKVWVSLKPST